MHQGDYQLKARKIEECLANGTVVIYGGGGTTEAVLQHVAQKKNLLAIIDGSRQKQGQVLHGIRILPPSRISTLSPDQIVICVEHLDVAKEIERSVRKMDDNVTVVNLSEIFPFYSYTTNMKTVMDSVAEWGKLPLLIFQVGKVGSTTILNSLQAFDPSVHIWHSHDLYRRYKDWNEQFGSNLSFAKQLKALVPDAGEEKVKVISLVRDPIARNLSAYFQNLEEGALDHNDLLIERFFKDFKHDYPMQWFDLEIQRVFGLDIYETPFNFDKGYQIYGNEDIELMVLRLENLKCCAGEAFQSFLGFSNFTLKNANVGEKKNYHQSYQTFKETIQIPDNYIKRMYESKYARYFYSEEELAKFRSRWSSVSVRG